ncbi:MAG: PAS domain-containing protein, partial [Gammaproteobacteria bacterium]|nr:PAS domain-containing protein [Gammaproteobacteria bacterium]
MLQRKSLAFIAITFTLIILDGLFITLNYHFSQKALEERNFESSKVLLSLFHSQVESTLQNLQLIASFIANDQEIQQIFLAGKMAVAAEGGGAGGSEAERVRQTLYQRLAPNWQQAMTEFGGRQLHFHLGPGSTSFLRFHRPDRFGDNMDQIRHTIVDTNREQSARSGFETGRVYSGLRGVVPVFATDPEQGEKVYVGALEAGSSFDNIITSIDHNLDVGVTLLLNRKHVEATMWPQAIQQRFGDFQTPCGCVIEASSRPGVEQLIQSILQQQTSLPDADSHLLLQMGEESYSAAFHPLRDYLGQIEPNRDNVGRILIWRNITPQITAQRQGLWSSIIYAIAAFIILELVIIFVFRKLTRPLLHQLQSNADILQTVAEHSNEFIYWRNRDQSQFLYTSPNSQRVLGYSPEELQQHPGLLEEMIHPEDRRLWDDHIESHDSIHPVLRFRIRTKTGETRWILHQCTPVYDQNNHYLGRRGSLADV